MTFHIMGDTVLLLCKTLGRYVSVSCRLPEDITYRQISQCEKMVYNDQILKLLTSFIHRSRMDVAQVLHDLSYKVCSTMLPMFLHFNYLF